MADLNAIYQELGLAGLVPHAIRGTPKARIILINKIKVGESLFMLQSPIINAPFLYVADNMRQALMFTTEQAAKRHAALLREQCMETEIHIFPENQSINNSMNTLHNLGVDAVYLDQMVSLPIRSFINLPTYDGYPNEEFPLINHDMNGAMHYYLQIAQAHMSNLEAEFCFARCLCRGHLLLPLDNSDPPNLYMLPEAEYETKTIIACSDWQQCQMADFQPVAQVLPVVPLFDQLIQDNINLLLNPAGTSLLIRPHYMAYLLQVAAAPTPAHIPLVSSLFSSQSSQDNWQLEDPTPSFLR